MITEKNQKTETVFIFFIVILAVCVAITYFSLILNRQ